ncbi:unnamed protein product [Lymnaea stagnalis]|uniref:Cytochrome P450 n=1 Tax=Lymnaea stagnalis TaxID=6523 RepID=A0AAV2GXS7_LYMST
MDWSTVLIASTVLLVIYWWFSRKDNKLPPYPTKPLPIVGHLFTLKPDVRPQFKEWHKRFGEIFCLNMAGRHLVILNGYDVIKEAFVKKADEFSDRAPFFFDEATGMFNKGITFANGQNWKEQRSVTLSILRNFGMGKNLLAELIQAEVEAFVELVVSLNGQPTNMRVNTNMTLANVISAFVVGRRFEYDDPTFQELMRKLRILVGGQTASEYINFLPFLSKLPGDYFGAKRLAANAKDVMDFLLKKFVREMRKDNPDADTANNFVAAYLVGRNKKTKAGELTLEDEENIVKTISDLYLAGAETTSTALLWLLLYATAHQDAQQRVHEEIEREIGSERHPTIQDRTKLVYLNAFILESQRLASVAGLGFTHLNPEEATLRGFKIPKGSFIIPNLDSILHDKKIWGPDVMCFKPERFITNDRKLKIPEQFIPFSIGRRVCLGEGLANTAMFLYAAALFQRFQMLPRDVTSPPEVKYVFGLDVSPVPFEVRFIDRRKI